MKANNYSRWIGACCLTVLVALYLVGAVSHSSLRHEIQTLPLWAPIVLGFRWSPVAKWIALPCLAVWLLLMITIWTFLAGWTHLISGHFTPVEVVLTIVIGAASACGIGIGLKWETATPWTAVFGIVLLSVALQFAALRLSFLPSISSR